MSVRDYSFDERLNFSKGRKLETDQASIKEMVAGAVSVRESTRQEEHLGIDYVASLRGGAEVFIDAKARQAGCSKYWRHEQPELSLENGVSPRRQMAGTERLAGRSAKRKPPTLCFLPSTQETARTATCSPSNIFGWRFAARRQSGRKCLGLRCRALTGATSHLACAFLWTWFSMPSSKFPKAGRWGDPALTPVGRRVYRSQPRSHGHVLQTEVRLRGPSNTRRSLLSVRFMAAVWKLPGMTLAQKMVLLKLSDCCDDGGSNAYPAVQTIADEGAMSVRSVQRALRWLEANRYIVVERMPTATFPASYRVVMDRGVTQSPLGVTPSRFRGDTQSGGVTPSRFRGANVAPDPSIDPSSDPSIRSMTSAFARAVDDLPTLDSIWESVLKNLESSLNQHRYRGLADSHLWLHRFQGSSATVAAESFMGLENARKVEVLLVRAFNAVIERPVKVQFVCIPRTARKGESNNGSNPQAQGTDDGDVETDPDPVDLQD